MKISMETKAKILMTCMHDQTREEAKALFSRTDVEDLKRIIIGLQSTLTPEGKIIDPIGQFISLMALYGISEVLLAMKR